MDISFEIIQSVWVIVSTPMVLKKSFCILLERRMGTQVFYRCKITLEN